MPHVQHPATGLPGHRKSFFQDFVENFVGDFEPLFVDFLLTFEIGFGLVGNLGDTVQNFLAEFVGLGTQLLDGKLLHLRLKRIDGRHARHQTLDLTFVFSAKNLA